MLVLRTKLDARLSNLCNGTSQLPLLIRCVTFNENLISLTGLAQGLSVLWRWLGGKKGTSVIRDGNNNGRDGNGRSFIALRSIFLAWLFDTELEPNTGLVHPRTEQPSRGYAGKAGSILLCRVY